MGKQFTSEYQPKKNGRPKGSLDVKAVLKRLLETDIEIEDLDGIPKKLKGLDAVTVALIREAKDGDVTAVREIYDRLDGKPKQVTDLNFTDRTLHGDFDDMSDEEILEQIRNGPTNEDADRGDTPQSEDEPASNV